jgi:signal transduction histidine kinase
MRRRTALAALVAVAVSLLLGSYVVYTQRVVRELQVEAERASRMYARVFRGLNDPRDESGIVALTDLAQMIRDAGVPLVITDADGRPTAMANVPAGYRLDDPRLAGFVAQLDRQNPPLSDPQVGTVHFGSTRLVRGLQVVPLLQAVGMGFLVLAGVFILLTHGRAERERVWAGMARESAHQLGTPLSSLHGWMEVLRDRAGDPLLDQALGHMDADLERLERVAHRFERIGRPPRREAVDLAALAERVVSYFRRRVPSLTTPVQLVLEAPAAGVAVRGDRVLLEWVLESLIKNAVDALAGIGGTITVRMAAAPGGTARLTVSDTGPGVPRHLRRRIFEAGFSTKERGWGIGLALTRRIVEESHDGRLRLLPSSEGAVFEVILPG